MSRDSGGAKDTIYNLMQVELVQVGNRITILSTHTTFQRDLGSANHSGARKACSRCSLTLATSLALLRSAFFSRDSLLLANDCCVCSEFQSSRKALMAVADCRAVFLMLANICALLAAGCSRGATSDGMVDLRPSSY